MLRAENGKTPARRAQLAAGWIGAALAVLVAAAVDVAAAEQADELDVETILDNPLSDDDYRDSKRCIGSNSYRRVEILDDSKLLFHGRNEVSWLNELPSRCPGLRPNMALVMQGLHSRMCYADKFRARDRSGFAIETPPCLLGRFETIDRRQVETLRQALQAQKRTSTVVQTQRAASQ